MNEIVFDLILDECLERIDSGASSPDECLKRYPENAARLKPLLLAASHFERARSIRPSTTFKRRGRAELVGYMQAHPHQKAAFPFRLAVGIAALLFAFVTTGTAFAQSALPGDALYGWKLTSEQAWRAVVRDRLAVDLSLAERRTQELLTVSEDPTDRSRARDEYQKAIIRLMNQVVSENEARILPVVLSQQDALEQAGLPVTPLNELVPVEIDLNSAPPTELVLPTPTPMPGPTATPVLEQIPTIVPSVIPLLESPPEIPTVFSSDNSGNPVLSNPLPDPPIDIPPLVP